MAQVKEHPILFNAESVRAILEGCKVQTRRVVKLPKTLPQSVFEYDHIPQGHFSIMRAWGKFSVVHWESDHAESIPLKCPYEVGMKLWIREAARVTARVGEVAVLEYQADKSTVNALCIPQSHYSKPTSQERDSFYSGRFMPRWASRITLEITDVRVEQVQDINEADCCAEMGCPTEWRGLDPEPYKRDLRGCFAYLWDSINKRRGFGWDTNCWVWCISFRRLD